MAVRDSLEPPVHLHPLKDQAADETRLDEAERILGHRFTQRGLLAEALTHRSAAGRRGTGSNERLEFVGDRVLGLAVAVWLAERFPAAREGDLGRRLGHLVSQPVLADIAERIGLDSVLAIAPGEVRAGVGRRATVLADAMEAVIGALFADGGIDAAQRFVRAAWASAIEAQTRPPKDAKTALQEWAQQRGLGLPVYAVAGREGPPHAPMFRVQVSLRGEQGEGCAGTKRAAEQLAASSLLEALR